MGGGNSGLKGNNQERKREQNIKNTLKSIVDKRKEAKIEFGYTLDLDGNILKMNRGGKTGCKITDCWDKIGVHNHPRGSYGEIGGTFSPADLCSMYITNRPVNYAFDQEYVYELRAINWSPKWDSKDSNIKNLDRFTKALNLKQQYSKVVNDTCAKAYDKAKEMRDKGLFKNSEGVTDYQKYSQYQARVWHQMLNNWLKHHANEFGYEYHVHSIKTGGYMK